MKRALLLFTILMSFDVHAGAFTTGNGLAEKCEVYSKPTATFSVGYCMAYATSIADVMSNQPVAGRRACFSKQMTQDQITKVVIKYLDSHPERLHYSAYSLVADALAEAFPCK